MIGFHTIKLRRLFPVFIVALSAAMTFAQGGGQRPTPTPPLPTYANYAAAMQAADGFLTASNYDKARLSFLSAMNLASDDDQRYDAHFGLAKVYLAKKSKVRLSSGEYVDRPEYYYAISEYEKAAGLNAVSATKKRQAFDRVIETAKLSENHWKVAGTYDLMIKAFPQMTVAEKTGLMFKKAEAYPLDNRSNATSAYQAYSAITTLAGVADTDKSKALIQMADLEYRFGNKQGAFQHFTSATLTPGATAEQKATATLLAGKVLWELGQADQGQAMMAKVFEIKDAPAKTKADAHTMLASSYEHQKKPDLQLAELAKIPSIKGVSDEDKSEAYYAMGQIHQKAERYPAARSEFKKIMPLKQAKNGYIAAAYYHTGKAYEKEKNVKEARAAWTKMFAIAEAPKHKSDAQEALAMSFRKEKKYADAAKALILRAAIDKLTSDEKHDALTDLGDVYLEQKDAAKAADAYAQAIPVQGTIITQDQRYRAYVGLVEARKLLNDAAKLAEAYGELADFTQRATAMKGNARNEKLQELWGLAETFGKDDATTPAALAIYEGIRKGNAGIVMTVVNRVHLGVGDILIRQRKFPEAKQRLEMVTVGRFPNSAELKAQVEQAKEKMKLLP